MSPMLMSVYLSRKERRNQKPEVRNQKASLGHLLVSGFWFCKTLGVSAAGLPYRALTRYLGSDGVRPSTATMATPDSSAAAEVTVKPMASGVVATALTIPSCVPITRGALAARP